MRPAPNRRVPRTLSGRALADGSNGRFISYLFSDPSVARDGDRILNWQIDDFRTNPVFLWAHDTSMPPIGRVAAITQNQGILKGAVEYADPDTYPFADTIYQLVRGGFLNAVSVSWIPLEYRYSTDPTRVPGAIDFTLAELLEVSQVPVPSLPTALAAAGSRGIDITPFAEWAESCLDRKDFRNMPAESLMRVRSAAGGSRIYAQPMIKKSRFPSFGDQMRAIATAEGGFEADPRLVRAGAGAGINDPSSGGFLVEDVYISELIGSIYEEAVIAPRCDRRPTDKPLAGTKIPAIDETSRVDGSRWGGVTSYWASEAEQVDGSMPKFKNIELAATKHIAIVYASAELLNDVPALGAYLNRAIASEISFKLDLAILKGTGAGVPLGILNSSALITANAENSQAAQTILSSNVASMWSRLPSPCRKRAVWLVNEDAMAQLDADSFSTIFMPAGAAGSTAPLLKGRPVLEVEQSPQLGNVGDIILADLSQYIIVDGGEKMVMSADALFIQDQIVFRFYLRVSGTPAWTSAITPYNGSLTRSPYVTLAARP